MKRDLFKAFLPLFVLLGCLPSALAQSNSLFKPLNPDDPKGLELGDGVPRTVDTNGNVIGIPLEFTTVEFQHAAVMLMLQEANSIALQLQLPEDMPITESNLTAASVSPFHDYYANHSLGNICTKKYAYIFAEDNKFDEVVVANYDATCLRLETNRLSVKQIDFTTSYQVAIQWMAAASIDADALNHDCKAQVALSPYWNGLSRIGQIPRKKIVPIYDVSWLSPENRAKHFGDVAFVELYLPTKQLIQFHVGDPKYISRKPLVFTNLASLFPGTAPVTLYTNPPAYNGPPLVAPP